MRIYNPVKEKERARRWRVNNLEKDRERKRLWKQNNPTFGHAWWAANPEYHNNRYATDINYRLAKLLRGRLYKALHRNTKSGSAVRDLGCSIDYLRLVLKEQFSVGMTWDNIGTYWEVDHITPLHQYDLSNPSQLLEACHYTNLQPLTKADHVAKTRSDLR